MTSSHSAFLRDQLLNINVEAFSEGGFVNDISEYVAGMEYDAGLEYLMAVSGEESPTKFISVLKQLERRKNGGSNTNNNKKPPAPQAKTVFWGPTQPINNNNGSRSAFLNLFNELSFEMIFRTKSIVYNSRDYGSWSFTLTKDDQSLIMDNLMGVYGKWGLTYNADEVSRLIISREGLGWKTSLDSRAYSGSPEKAFKQIGIEPNFEMDTFSMDVSVNWPYLPWEVDYGNIIGDVDLNIKGLVIKNREELQAQNNLLRIVNIFNITDSFEKITNLDFRKLYKTGFSADSVNGVINISRNDLNIKSPLVFKSGSSEFSWKGNILRDEKVLLKELNLEVVMTLPLRDYLPAYAFLLGGPITAGIVYIAGKAFERNLDQLSSGSWSITGTLEEPVTNFNGWFESTRE